MSQAPLRTGEFRVADLPTSRPFTFELHPSAEERAKIAESLDVLAIRKLTFDAELQARGKRGWVLTGKLGATVSQACVVTLDPVTTRIDETIQRRYLPQLDLPEAGSETEMPEDDTTELLGDVISVHDVMIEALSLALPAYPRAAGSALGDAVFTEPGSKPMTDADARPFAGLQALRDKLDKDS
ncbi:MAG: DUF177 domain-containing protein [Rhodobacteraceae bacterium]|nr:DUF177 domain-containing protein [Paracoccaceae bacterium]